MGLPTLLRILADVALPPTCGACGLPGPPLCGRCRAGLVAPPPPLCDACGHPWPLAVTRCPECAGPIARARQAALYAGPAPRLVAAFKDARRRDLAGALAAVMADRLPPPAAGTVLVPVPLERGRGAERGFNQAALLARELGDRWRRPVAEALVRPGPAPAQRGASATDRRRQVAGAFRAAGPAPLAPCLVDDVHTTGSTLAACARALRAAGARRVVAVAFARATRDPGPGGPAPAAR